MKKKLKLVLIVLVIILLCYKGAIAFAPKLLKVGFSTPEEAIKFYVLVRNGPLAASQITIEKGTYCDPRYGQQYVVRGYRDRETGMEIMFFYLRKNEKGLWEVASAGTGP